MNTINKQSVEENYADLQGQEAQEKIRQLYKKASTCFFCTNIGLGKSFSTRPMAVREMDDNGNFWFLSARDSIKNIEIQQNSSVQLLFQGSDYSDFLSLSGKATVTYDERKIKELWSPMLKTWFTEGENDPRISAIKFEPIEGYYWDTKHNQVVGFAKRIAGAIAGKTMDDSIEGTLRPATN